MGGNALKIATERMDKATHSRLSKSVVDTLREDGFKADVTEHYRLKESFGDIDILVEARVGFEWREYITEKFCPQDISKNGSASDNVHSYSFDLENHQVDLLIVQQGLYPTTEFYYSCGMFGDLVGRVAMAMGAKFGVFGLEYRHNKPGTYQRIGTINLSTDKYQILRSLGFSIERYEQGFDTVEDMFEFITSSTHFNIYYFDFDNLNAAKRAKNLRRKEYVQFLEYVKDNRPDIFDKPALSYDEQLSWMITNFPEANVLEKVDAFNETENRRVLAKEKFNGKVVMEQLGLTNKDLSFLKGFSEQHNDYISYILENPVEKIIQDVKNYLKVN